MSMSIKKGDNVKVLSGKDRGKTGTVLRALPSEGKVVVEGVEHLENVRLMKECGCSIAQGYYFAKPMDEESFRNVFKEGRIC